MIPVLVGPVVLATEKPMLPLPDPEAPEVTVSHEALLVAFQVQAGAVLMENELLAPSAASVAPDVESV
jgi:hypothetical protein